MSRKGTELAPGIMDAGRKLLHQAITPAFMVLFGMLLVSATASAQYVTNGAGGGAWTSPGTWAGGVVPTGTSPGPNVTIAGNDSVWTDPTNVVNCGNLDIQSGAKLNVLGSGIKMSGAFSIESGARYINNTDSAKAWPVGASSYTIDPSSTFELGSAGSSTLGSNLSDSTFGNVVIDPNVGGGISCGANLTINGNLTINCGSGKTFRGMAVSIAQGEAGPVLVHHVLGNVTVVTGVWSAVDGDLNGMKCTWNIDGNVTIGDSSTGNAQARMGPLSSASTVGNTRIGVFNIGGNLSFVNGGRLQGGSSSGSASITEMGIFNIKGNLTFEPKSSFYTGSKGILAINFVGTKPQTVTLGVPVSFSSSTVNATVNDTVAAGASVTFTGGNTWKSSSPSPANGNGGFIVNGKLYFGPADTLQGLQHFVLNPGATLGIGSPYGIVATTDPMPDSGNIQVDSVRSFSAQANYVYNGVAAQVTGSGLPSTVNDLTIDNPDTVTLSQATTINGTLYLTAGTFDNTIPFTLGPNGKLTITGGKLVVPTAVNSAVPSVPQQFSLDQNYPNPFNPTTEIQFAVPKNAYVTLTIYNALGQKVATLVDGNLTPGVYQRVFDGSRYASGLYIARLVAGNHVMTDKMLMIK